MFEIDQHDSEYRMLNTRSNIQLEIEDIDDDIYADFDNLINNRIDRLYLKDKFKCNGFGVDIIYPGITYPGNKTINMRPDHIRFLLSLYPQKQDLGKVDRIILQPKHIEINSIELISFYIRRENTLVFYLYHPHYYEIKNSKFQDYTKFIPYSLSQLFTMRLIKAPQ